MNEQNKKMKIFKRKCKMQIKKNRKIENIKIQK